VPEIVPKARLDEGAGIGIERPAGRIQDLVNERRYF
jgi:hypothetical protein